MIKTLKDTGECVICNMNFKDYLVQLNQKADDIEFNPADDLAELKWFEISELSKIKLTPPSVELFKGMGYIQ